MFGKRPHQNTQDDGGDGLPPWSKLPDLRGGDDTWRLRHAMVSDEGDMLGVGGISLPAPIPPGFEPASPEQGLVIVGGSAITLCLAERDPQSGFFRVRRRGLVLGFPHAVGEAVQRYLRFEPKAPVSIAIQDRGVLTAWFEDEKSARQGVSDWRVEILEHEGFVRVRLSAALRRILPEGLGEFRIADHWPMDSNARLTAQFAVDPITRAAKLGAYGPAIESKGERIHSAPNPTSLSSLNLESAPVGAPIGVFGVHRSGQWVAFGSGEALDLKHLYFEQPGPHSRDRSGLMALGEYRLPRVTIRGADIGVICTLLRSRPEASLSLRGGNIGDLYWGDGSDGGRRALLDEAELHFKLSEAGLHISYHVHADDIRGYNTLYRESPTRPGWLDGELTLPWEVLILRYPAFWRGPVKAMRRPE